MPPSQDVDADLLRPERCLAASLHAAARAVSRIYARELRPLGVRRGQFGILATLAAREPLPVTALAERLALDRTTLTRHLDALRRAGWVHVQTDPDDARRRRVALSREGRERYGEVRAAWRRAQARVVAAFGPGNVRDLQSRLRRLREQAAETGAAERDASPS